MLNNFTKIYMEDTKLPQQDMQEVNPTPDVKPKKKMSGCLIVFLVFLGVLLLLLGGAYLGYKKISKDLQTQADLGVRYTQKDILNLDSLVTITPENYLELKDGIDLSLTSAQVTAMLNAQTEGPTFSNTQIKFNKNNFEISSLVTFEMVEENPLELPLYISADVVGITKNTLKLDIENIKIGLFKLPNWIQGRIAATSEAWLENVVLENLSSLDFKSITLTNNRVDIKGLLLDELR